MGTQLHQNQAGQPSKNGGWWAAAVGHDAHGFTLADPVAVTIVHHGAEIVVRKLAEPNRFSVSGSDAETVFNANVGSDVLGSAGRAYDLAALANLEDEAAGSRGRAAVVAGAIDRYRGWTHAGSEFATIEAGCSREYSDRSLFPAAAVADAIIVSRASDTDESAPRALRAVGQYAVNLADTKYNTSSEDSETYLNRHAAEVKAWFSTSFPGATLDVKDGEWHNAIVSVTLADSAYTSESQFPKTVAELSETADSSAIGDIYASQFCPQPEGWTLFVAIRDHLDDVDRNRTSPRAGA